MYSPKLSLGSGLATAQNILKPKNSAMGLYSTRASLKLQLGANGASSHRVLEAKTTARGFGGCLVGWSLSGMLKL